RDNGPWETLPAVTTIAVGNANYYGGGIIHFPFTDPLPTPTTPPPSSPCPQRDNGPWETLSAVTTIALGNANYYGGGMKNKDLYRSSPLAKRPPPISSPCSQRDSGPWETLPAVTTIAVGNANYYGGGMKICPHANPSSGSLDVRLGLGGAGIDGGQGGHR
ncbi:unnamed protein product, partial [Closterium sp. NIES-64]